MRTRLIPRRAQLLLATFAVLGFACDGSGNGETDAGPNTSGVVINEVAPSGLPDDWVELYNAGSIKVDIGGWSFTDTDELHVYIFPDDTVLAPGELIHVVRSTGGPFDFGLGGADMVRLFDAEGHLVDEIAWTDADVYKGAIWGRYPDGTGDFGTVYNPTPGAPNAQRRGLVLNEISSSGDDAIELVNNSNASVEIGGWTLSDERGATSAEVYVFEDGKTVAAGERVLLSKNTDHPFGLGDDDAVLLYDQFATLVDRADFDLGEAKTSFCRLPDGEGHFRKCKQATLDLENTY